MNSVIVKETFNASLQKVWEALTDPSKLKQWYFDIGEFRAEVGFEFTFMGQGTSGTPYKHLCQVTEVIPLKKLQYSWKYEGYPGNSLVTFELYEEDKQTHLTLTHLLLEPFPLDNPDLKFENFHEGWSQLIKQILSKFLTGEEV